VGKKFYLDARQITGNKGYTVKYQCCVSGAFLTPGSGVRIREGKKFGSGMNIPDNFYKSLETIFRVKILLMRIWNLLSWIRDGKN
jgi:hypothetical protein